MGPGLIGEEALLSGCAACVLIRSRNRNWLCSRFVSGKHLYNAFFERPVLLLSHLASPEIITAPIALFSAMVRAEFPEYPMFHSLRLASASDVGRMAELSVLGFKDSEIFKYERPNYDEYPQDTLAGVRNMYRSQLLHPRAVVIVAEDCYCDDEVASEYQFSAGNKVNKLSKRVVVGVASWFLPDGSPRTGQFVVPDVGKLEPTKDRDLSKHRLKVFTAISDVIESK